MFMKNNLVSGEIGQIQMFGLKSKSLKIRWLVKAESAKKEDGKKDGKMKVLPVIFMKNKVVTKLVF